MSEQIFWFATRSAGILCWFAALASVLVGLMMTSRLLGRRPTLPYLTDLHRFLGAMSMVFLGIHMVTLYFDPWVGWGLAELLIPGRAQSAGLTSMSLALGVVAAYVLVVVELSSLIKSHLPKRVWHTIHLTSLGSVVMGAVHGIQTGTDRGNRVLVAAATSALMATVMIGTTRVVRYFGDQRYRRDSAANAALAAERIPVAMHALRNGDRRITNSFLTRPGGQAAAQNRIPPGVRERAAAQDRNPAAVRERAAAQDRIPAAVRERAAARAGGGADTGQVPQVAAKRAGRRRGAAEAPPPWMTEQTVDTQAEASWNNGETSWDWNTTLRKQGGWDDDGQVVGRPGPPGGERWRPGAPATSGNDDGRRDRPVAGQDRGPGEWFSGSDPVEAAPWVGHHDDSYDDYDYDDHYHDGHYHDHEDEHRVEEPPLDPPVFRREERPAAPAPVGRTRRPETDPPSGRSPRPAPDRGVDGVTPRWGLYRTADHDLSELRAGGAGFDDHPDDDDHRDRLSYAEARRILQGRHENDHDPGR